jgi:hypothetical protein
VPRKRSGTRSNQDCFLALSGNARLGPRSKPLALEETFINLRGSKFTRVRDIGLNCVCPFFLNCEPRYISPVSLPTFRSMRSRDWRENINYHPLLYPRLAQYSIAEESEFKASLERGLVSNRRFARIAAAFFTLQ